jgi:hypothetical protein
MTSLGHEMSGDSKKADAQSAEAHKATAGRA